MTDKKGIFIIRACEVHGINKYDYSQIKYVNLNTKIEIICEFNHVFEQIPSVHLRGFGCPKCSGKHKKTTDEFIIEAQKIHFDYYDYSMVLYKNSSSKVNIICKKHGLFEQNTKNHLNGNGCPKCFGNNKKTTDEFIIEAQKIHFDRYDYSRVLYKGSSTNVIIICKDHGFFEQTPTTHLSGHGCNICGNLTIGLKLRNTIEHFIKKSQEVHGIDKYDYSKVLYRGNKIKISIICNEHGLFEQTPLNHVKGHGCPKCVGKNKTLNEFITESTKIHLNRYDYSMILYKNNSTKLSIICKKHGLFEQHPQHHLHGHGCPKCAGINKTTDEFIIEANKIHLNHYNYSNVLYINSSTKINIICNKHGFFEQTPNSHLRGGGCPKCYNKHSKSSINWLNFFQMKDNIEIQHGKNIGEFRIPNTRFSADGFCEQTNTIYEFHGDYWHGNPKIFIRSEINNRTNCTFGELYQRTIDREQQIRDLGYNLITIWENDWKKLNRYVKILQRKYRKSKLR